MSGDVETEQPVFSIRGVRMFGWVEHAGALAPVVLIVWIAIMNGPGRHPGLFAVQVAFVPLLVGLWWWQFSRCSFELFVDRIELRMWNKLLPRGESVIPLDAVKYVRLRGATLRVFVRPGAAERVIFRVPFRRVVAEDFMDRFEMMCEEEGVPFAFAEDGSVWEARRVGG